MHIFILPVDKERYFLHCS